VGLSETATLHHWKLLYLNLTNIKIQGTRHNLLQKNYNYLKTYLKSNLSCRNNSQNVVQLRIGRLTLRRKDENVSPLEVIKKLFQVKP